MKNSGLLIGILAIAVVALIGFIISERATRAGLEAKLAEAEAKAAQTTLIGSRAKPAADETAGEITRLKNRVQELESRLAAASAGDGESAAGSGKKDEGNGAGDVMKSWSRMMNDPAMRDMIAQQQRVLVDGMFGPLMSELELTPEQEDAFHALLLEKQMAAAQIGMQLLDKSRSAEERKQISDEFKENTKRLNEDIKTAIGEEAFESYQLFEKSQPERQQLDTYKQALSQKGLNLSQNAEEELMTVMFDSRTNFKFSTDFGSESSPNPDAIMGFNQQRADQYLGEFQQLQEQVYQKAGAILTPEQLEAFRANQESFRKMQEMGIQMSLGFMGEKK